MKCVIEMSGRDERQLNIIDHPEELKRDIEDVLRRYGLTRRNFDINLDVLEKEFDIFISGAFER